MNLKSGQESKASGNLNISEYLSKEKHHSEHNNLLAGPGISQRSDRHRKTSEGPRKVNKMNPNINLLNQNSNQKLKQINTRVLINERSELSQSFFSSAHADTKLPEYPHQRDPADKSFYSTGVIPTK